MSSNAVEGLDLVVTNMHRNFTGVTATTAAVARQQEQKYRMLVAGRALPGCQGAISLGRAFWRSLRPSTGHRFVLWHVRRNNEMRAALFARDILRLPIRIAFTSSAQRRHSAIPRWLILRMDAVIATTESAASYVPNVHAVVPHGVDSDKFYPAEDRELAWKQLGYPGKYGVATIGRIRPEKGTDVFVDAMVRVLPQFPEATALIIGRVSSSQRRFHAQLVRRISEAGLTQRIVFAGEVEWTRLPQIMRGLSLLVAPARYEGYGLTPLEAMASGVPVVATDRGHFSNFVGNNEAGTLIDNPEPLQIANAVNDLFQDPKRLRESSLIARHRAVSLFDVSAEVNGIHKVYRKLWM